MSKKEPKEYNTFKELVDGELPDALKKAIEKPSVKLPWNVEMILCCIAIPLLIVTFLFYLWAIVSPTM
ncbi:MAG: hypothetical protein Q4F99_06465 [bacterium]|nr:hypothetical protein [bacterium]